MSEFEVNLSGAKVKVDTSKSIDEIKKDFAESTHGTIFDNVDANNNGYIDTEGELDTFKSNLKAQGYTLSDEETSAEQIKSQSSNYQQTLKAYNQSIQVMRNRYQDPDGLKSNFKSDESDLHVVEKGQTLYEIAKKALEDEGLEPTRRAVNDRISQIAVMNNLGNVNRIEVGQKLIVHLTPEGVEKVKADENQNSAAALGGITSASATTASQKTRKTQATKPEEKAPKATQTTPQRAGQNTEEVSSSSIKLTKNINLEDEGWTEAADQSDIRTDGFKEFDSDHESVKKYEKTENGTKITKYQLKATFGIETYIYIQADTVEELKTKYNKFYEADAKIKFAEADESEEAAKKRKAENLAALKTQMATLDYNVEYVSAIIRDALKGEDVDRNSDEFKALVSDLIRTKNVSVLAAILKNGSIYNETLLVNDEQSSRDVAGLFAEIRAKENAGEKLSKQEIKAKKLLQGYRESEYMQKIEADAEHGIHEKYMDFASSDGRMFYDGEVCKITVSAGTKELFEEFAGKLEAANKETDPAKKNEALQALFKEYMNTTDKDLARTLAMNAKALNAAQEDLFTLIDNNDIIVLSNVELPDNYTEEGNKLLVDKVLAKYYAFMETKDIGNAHYIEDMCNWIDERGDVKGKDGNGKDITIKAEQFKKEIISKYFFTTETIDGKTVVKFTPNRRPTFEEIERLCQTYLLSEEQKNAIADTIKRDDIGEGQFSDRLEDYYGQWPMYSKNIEQNRSYLNRHYAKMVEELETPEQALEFMKDIGTADYDDIPFEEIFNKFGDNKEVQVFMLKNVERDHSALSFDNRVKLLKTVITEKDGKFSLDRTKLPDGVTMENLVTILPTDCTKSDTKKMFELFFDTVNFSDRKERAAAYVLIAGHEYGAYDNNKKEKVKQLIQSDSAEKFYAELRDNDFGVLEKIGFTQSELEEIYNELGPVNKAYMLKRGHFKKDGLVLVKSGDRIDNIVKDYLKTHLDKFPQLKNSIEHWYGNLVNTWDDARINKALNKYLQQFRADILNDLGISDPTKLKEDDIIDLNKVQWENHQPGWWEYNMTY